MLVKMCDLFTNIEKCNGTFIRASGDIETGHEGGPSLSGKGCPSKIKVKGKTFPNLIQLANPKSPVGLVYRVDFTWDENNRGEFWGWLMRVDSNKEHLYGTVVACSRPVRRSPI